MKRFLGWLAAVWLVLPAIAGDTAGTQNQNSAQPQNLEGSQLLRGTSGAKILNAAAPVHNSIVAWDDLAEEISDSPETPSDERGEYEGTVVNDVYVRWDQDECNPCEVPTLAPTLPPIYPHSDDSYEDHLPVVTDEYDSWDDVKEGNTRARTDAPTADQDEDEDEIVYNGGIRCSKVVTAEGGVYQCESPAGNVYCTKVSTEYGESYDCHSGTVRPLDTTAPPTDYYEPTPAPTNVETLICPNGERSIGVAGWDHDGCVVSGNVCIANTFGDCPRGAHCTWLDTGVYGCSDGQGCADNEQTIGVVGWDHDGCIVSDNICVAQVKNGDCPRGSYCSLLDTGIYGCVAGSRNSGGSTTNGGSTNAATGGTSTTGTTGATTGGTAKTWTTTGGRTGETTGGTSTGTTSGETTGTTTGGTSTTTTTGTTSGGVTTGGTSTGTATGGKTTTSTDTSNANTGATTTPSTGDYGGDAANTAGATTTASTGNTASAGSSTDALSAGTIAGIVVGCAVFVAIVVGAVIFHQKSLARQREENLFADLSDTGGATDYAAM